jgi:hypothetical protein
VPESLVSFRSVADTKRPLTEKRLQALKILQDKNRARAANI